MKFSLITVFLLSMAMLAGCQNTVNGFGKDMQQNGQAIEKQANTKN